MKRLARFAAILVASAVPLAARAADPSIKPAYVEVIIPGSPVEVVGGFVRGRVEGLAQYIGYLYNFLLGAIGIVAAVAIVIGGFEYLTAAGDKSKVDSAKKRIYNAIAGIVIAFTAFLLLNTINPALVNLKNPYVPTVLKDKAPFGGYRPISAPSHLCTQDSDCASLGAGYKCFHNLPGNVGKADGQCALEQTNAPQNATCSADGQCADNRKCLKRSSSSDSGNCSRGAEGDICYGDENCLPPRRCVAAGGGYSYCSSGTNGSHCSSDSDCYGAGLKCKSVGGAGKCAPAAGVGEGELCTKDEDCAGSDVPVSSATAEHPRVTCLKPSGTLNPTCKIGGDYEQRGIECFCHAAAPEEAQGVGLYCFTDEDCYRGLKPPQLRCVKNDTTKAYGQCAQ